MGLSIEDQRERIRAKRDPKRFHSVKHLKIDRNKIKGSDKQVKNKIDKAYREVEKLLGGDYYLTKKQKRKKSNKGKVKRKKKQLSEKQKKYRDYLKSSEWVQLRIDLLKFRGYKCERCGVTKNLHVHHLHYDNIFKEEPEDLEILCDKCHTEEHKGISIN